ncbi:multidrug resistance protein [Erwinia tracheiphila PSU-1]|nr:multidrug resistance protein [Erwinia tracheiphila PSU-1]
MPVGVTYAIWSGVGIVLISLVVWLWHGQYLDSPAIIGLVFIVAGGVIINTLSCAVFH